MGIFSLFGKKIACSLDLGQNWAKVVKLSPGRTAPSLIKMGRISWKRSDWQNKKYLAEKLAQFWSQIELKEKTVITSMAGHDVIIKRVDLPYTSSKSEREDIYKHAQEYIPFNIDDVYLDVQEIGGNSREKNQNVLLVASKKQMVHDLQDLLQQANLGIYIIDVDGFALSNCFEFNYPEMLSNTTYLLDIGETHSTFCVYSQMTPVFVRDIAFGGQQITDKLNKLLDKESVDIEKIKISGTQDIEPELRNKVKQAMEDTYSVWSEEVQQLINFYQNSQQDAQSAEKILLSGGGSLIPGAKESLRSYLNMEIEHMNPWRQINCNHNQFDSAYLSSVGPQFAISVGLALRTLR